MYDSAKYPSDIGSDAQGYHIYNRTPEQTAASQPYVPAPNEELYGTWTNEKYGGDELHPQEVVITSETYAEYWHTASNLPPNVSKLWIVDKWRDSDGNIWYKVNTLETKSGYKAQGIFKLSNQGTVMESIIVTLPFGSGYDPSQYPREIDKRLH